MASYWSNFCFQQVVLIFSALFGVNP